MPILLFFYTVSLYFYGFMLWLASFFSAKARLWVWGRKDWKNQLREKVQAWKGERIVWFHCASLGEFEQGRPLIEKIKQEGKVKIMITFFSPSGYEVRKNYELADAVMYLPLDNPSNAHFFVETLQPNVVFFVKYELWLHFIAAIHKRQIPLFLIAAKWRKENKIFSFPIFYLYKDALNAFSKIFTQDEDTRILLQNFVQKPLIITTGDTRFDRIIATKEHFRAIPEIADFLADKKEDDVVVLVGSAWDAEEKIIKAVFEETQHNTYYIIAPHEINADKISAATQLFPAQSVRFSSAQANATLLKNKKILWIDNIGMLSRLYYYADIAFVGGGFSGELHNILEPCVFGNMIVMGNRYKRHKFTEASDLIVKGGGFTVENKEEFKEYLEKYRTNRNFRKNIQQINTDYTKENAGATEKIWKQCKDLII